MKKLLFSALVAFGISQVSAQQGETLINVGVGFDSWSGVPVYVGAEHYVTDDITVGGQLEYGSASNYGYQSLKVKADIFSVGAVGNYYFDRLLSLPSEWDVYAGLNLTYYPYNIKDDVYKVSGSNTGFGAQVGTRYFFAPNWAANLEFGGGSQVSGGKIGVTYKF
ncbi:outer membrane beta-barrel protein [Ornithobacterium rhinotracheale]|uniref:outer membrane beta-barrel protein n=1 Tax=Ornithobacterium rhinotracheale TaxID=28251 RepID=UPI003872C112